MPALATLGPFALYVTLFVLIFAESGVLLGFFLPGDTVLLAAGGLSADPRHRLSLATLVLVVLLAAVTGDALGYATGRRAGPALFARAQRRPRSARALLRARALYAGYGALAVVAARWIPWVRVLVPVLAGVSQMPRRQFVLANVLGAVLWGGSLLVFGNLLAGAWH